MTGGFGFHGKIPALGDFVRAGLPPGFVSGWDAWLAQGLSATRVALAQHWPTTYQTAPIWRFALGRDVLPGGPWVGVMMPSQDAVGRLFPLTIAAASPAPDTGLDDEGFFLPLENAALDMLDSLNGKDALLRALSEMALPLLGCQPAPHEAWWHSAPAEGHGDALRLRSHGLPDLSSFRTLISTEIDFWTGLVVKEFEK